MLTNLNWMDWHYYSYAEARIEAGRFDSEEAFLRWQFTQPGAYTARDQESSLELVSAEKVYALTKRLEDLGVDICEFNGLKRDLLTKQLHELELKLQTETMNRRRRQLELGISKTNEALAAL